MENNVPQVEEKDKYYYPNYAVTRRQKRFIANRKMKEAGERKYRKHSYSTISKGSFEVYTRNPSFFAEHWREAKYQEV